MAGGGGYAAIIERGSAGMKKTSSAKKVCELYEGSAESYATMMDSEIDLPLYAATLGRLYKRILDVPGPVVDTACGPGHMLLKYRQSYDADRPLIGLDLSPRMAALARARLGAGVEVITGDMRDLAGVKTTIPPTSYTKSNPNPTLPPTSYAKCTQSMLRLYQCW